MSKRYTILGVICLAISIFFFVLHFTQEESPKTNMMVFVDENNTVAGCMYIQDNVYIHTTDIEKCGVIEDDN